MKFGDVFDYWYDHIGSTVVCLNWKSPPNQVSERLGNDLFGKTRSSMIECFDWEATNHGLALVAYLQILIVSGAFLQESLKKRKRAEEYEEILIELGRMGAGFVESIHVAAPA